MGIKPGEPITWSYSRIDTFERCPRRGYEIYVNDKRSPETEATLLGGIVHAALLGERDEATGEVTVPGYLTRLAQGDQPSPSVLNELVNTHFEQAEAEHPDLVEPWSVGVGINLGKAALKRLPPNPHTWAMEQEVRAKLPGGDVLRGFLDLTYEDEDGAYVVRDYKSNRAIYKSDDKHQQLGLYAALLSANGRQPARVELHFLRLEEVVSAPVTREMMDNARAWVLAVTADVKKRLPEGIAAFEPKPNHLCQYCHVADRCPAALAAFERANQDEMRPIESETEARNDALDIAMLEGMIGTLEERLKEYVKARGPVAVDDRVWGFIPTEYKNWRLKGLDDALRQHKLELADVVKVDNKKVEAHMAANPALAEALRKFYSVKKSTRFGSRAAESEGEAATAEVA